MLSGIHQQDCDVQIQSLKATKECGFLARMSHPNIITYKEYFEVAGPPQSHAAGPWSAAQWNGARPGGARGASTLYIIMSYADGGDLEARVKAQQKLGGAGPHARFVPFQEQQVSTANSRTMPR